MTETKPLITFALFAYNQERFIKPVGSANRFYLQTLSSCG